MAAHTSPPSKERMQQALLYILQRLPAQALFYATALGAIVLTTDVHILPEFASAAQLVSGIGGNILSDLIIRIARGDKVNEQEIEKQVNEAIRQSNIQALLTEKQFYHAIRKLVERLDLQDQELRADILAGIESLATRQQADRILELQRHTLILLRQRADTLTDSNQKPESTSQQPSIIETQREAIRDVLEFMYILDWIVREIKSLEAPWNTFGESRRILRLVDDLRKKVIVRVTGLKVERDREFGSSVVEQFDPLLQQFIGEADYALPHIGEGHWSRDRDRMKEIRYLIVTEWQKLLKQLYEVPVFREGFEGLKADESHRWTLLGFENVSEYHEYIGPGFETLCKKATEIEWNLLSVLTQYEEINQNQLLEHGFPIETVVETINSLMRSKLMQAEESGSFRLSKVGRDMINRRLRKLDNQS